MNRYVKDFGQIAVFYSCIFPYFALSLLAIQIKSDDILMCLGFAMAFSIVFGALTYKVQFFYYPIVLILLDILALALSAYFKNEVIGFLSLPSIYISVSMRNKK